MTTLAALMEQEDERRFVGRGRELKLIDEIVAGDGSTHVLIVRGPGGIGKSALLREARRRAERAGWATRSFDGRDGSLTASAVDHELLSTDPNQGLLLLLDTYERLTALGPLLRSSILPALPGRTAVLIAQRGAPDPGWLQGGWERLTREVELSPITGSEARDLLVRDGIEDTATTEALLSWAGGQPLALALGAEVLRDGGTWGEGGLDDHPELADLLLRRLTDTEVDASHLDVITVASIARRVDAEMLTAVLPGVDGSVAEAWLGSRTFVEQLGAWMILHDLVRGAVRSRARHDRPDRERELRRRIAEHLYDRACAGEAGLMPDMADLVDNEGLRWGIPGEAAGLRADEARAVDLEGATELGEKRGASTWWAATMALVREAPECVVMARDDEDTVCGLCIAVTPLNAPPAAERDIVLKGWLAHARATFPDGNVLVWRDSIDLTPAHGEKSSRVLAVMNTAAVMRSGLANPRWSYLPIDPANPAAVEFARIVDAQHLPELDVTFDDLVYQCHLLDHGPGGMLAAHRASVYHELGLKPPPPGADADQGASTEITAETVKDALRNLDRPLELARSPLAHGQTVSERAAGVRALVAAATEGAFGATQAERLLHDVIAERYLSAPTTHEQVADRLHVSRSTYFRHLGAAVDRVADFALLARAGTAA